MSSRIYSFSPIEDQRAVILILGSMPGRASLEAGQYYAHPRNAFWKIMGNVLGFEPTVSYASRVNALKTRGIALWDVLNSCIRRTSADTDIRRNTIRVNDIPVFLKKHPHIRAIYFNGTKAEEYFNRYVLPSLGGVGEDLRLVSLPSTSPAHAAMNYADKCRRWGGAIRSARPGRLVRNDPF